MAIDDDGVIFKRKSRLPLHAYYSNFLLFPLILGSRTNSIALATARFVSVLAMLLGILYGACAAADALLIPGAPIGLLEDWVMSGVIIWQIAGVPVFLWGVRQLDLVLNNMPLIVKTSSADEKDNINQDIATIRDVVSAKHPTARRCYWLWMLASVSLVIFFQIAIPLDPTSPDRSWAIWPQQYPELFILGIAWALFYYVFVIAQFVWFILTVTFFVFPQIYHYARSDRLIISPIAPDERGGMQPLGLLAFAVLLLSSGGLFIAGGWVYQFSDGNSLNEVRVTIGIYGVVLAVLYFLPLWYVHQAMKRAKAANLLSLGAIFVSSYSVLMNTLEASGDAAGAEASATAIEAIQQVGSLEGVYRRIEEMPTWPTSTIVSTIASSISGSPIVLAASPIIQKLILSPLWEILHSIARLFFRSF